MMGGTDELLMTIYRALEWAEAQGMPKEYLDALIVACGIDYDG